MYSLFVGVDFPPEIKRRIAMLCNGLPGALWREESQIHLTVRFVGSVDGGVFADVRDELSRVRMDPFHIILNGIGFFPPRREPQTIWVGVEKNESLIQLHDCVDWAIIRCGIPPEKRKYAPHVTIGRFGAGPVKSAKPNKLAQYLSEYSLFKTEPIRVDRFHLFSSARSNEGPIYLSEAEYPLTREGVINDEDLP